MAKFGFNRTYIIVVIAGFLLSPSIFAQTSFTSTPGLTGTYNSAYTYNITTSGLNDRDIVLSSGTLPTGLTLVDNGDGSAQLSGTVAQVGSFPLQLTVVERNDNSQFDKQDFTLVISKATATISFSNLNPTYDGTPKAAGVTTVPAGLTVNITYDASLATPTNAGNYAVDATISDTNYEGIASTIFSISKAPLTATADNKTRQYGQLNPTFSISYSGFLGGDSPASITPPTASTTATVTSSVGSYAITLLGGTATNYTLALVNGSLSVTKATLTATAEDKSRTYGSSNPAFTISYVGFLNGDTPASITPPTASNTATVTSSVGSYTITLSGGTATNYTLALVNGSLSVTKATLTATAEDKSRTYGSSNPAFTISYVGFLNGDTPASITPPTASTTATVTSSVGSYAITLSGGTATNYTLALVNGSLSVTKATLTATADDKSRTYGSSNPAFTISYVGFLNGDTPASITPPTASTTATVTSSVGTYPITLSGGTATNYTIALVNGSLSVTKATLTATTDDKTRTYGSANPAFTISYVGFLNGDTPASITPPTASTTATVTSSVGSYSITLSGGTATNYTLALVNGSLNVTTATLTATADDKSRTYGSSNPAFTISYVGFLNGDTPASITPPTASTTATVTSSVGSYAITLSGGTATNYTLVLVNGSLSVTKATLTATADDKSRTYGSANPAFTVSYIGFLNGDTPASITPPTASTTATVTSSVGSYAITLSGGTATNYTLALVNGSLSVTKATLTATADDKSRTYGSSNPAFTISYVGFLNGDTPASITPPTSSTAATVTSNVGLYSIALSGGSALNYSLALVNGTLTVTKAALTLIADDKSRAYGSSNPILTITYTGFLNGDNSSSITVPSISTSATTLSSVGTYPITLSGGTAINYTIALQNGTLTITKATLTAKADDKSRPYATANPSFTITYTGFLNGDNTSSITPSTASTTALISSNVGSYPINLTGGSALNYSFVLQSGTLTITKVTPTVTWNNPATITYGTALSATQLNATASIPGSFSYAPGNGTILNAGANQALSVNFTPSDLTNYNTVNGTQVLITVLKATPTVSWANPSAISYGTALGATQLNATATVAGSFVYTPPSGTVLNAGANQTLSVNFTPTDVANYNSVNGTTVSITVNKATPSISWPAPAAITYGTALSAIQLNASTSVAGSFVYSPTSGTVLNAGSNQTLSVNFTPTDLANYNTASANVLITVNRANPIITWPTPSAITYGTALSATQLNASANVPGTFTYTPSAGAIINAGASQVLSVNFVPTDASNYNSIIGFQRFITVNKATPVITWPPPLPIRVGVALSATQLNATANVAGSFTYTPSSGTVLAAGANQVLSVNFTPADLVNYNVVNGTQVLITVNLKDNPIITWNNPSAITYGTPLSATQLNATANVPGTFAYTPLSGTILNAGANQVLSVTFTPTDGVTYNMISLTAQINVNKAVLTATPANSSRSYGQANPTFTINYSGFVNGDNPSVIDTPPTSTSSAVVSSPAGSTFPIVAAGGADNNYTFSFVNGILTITKANLTAKADDKSRSYGLSNPTFTISYSGFVNGDNASSLVAPIASTAAMLTSNVGSYPITLLGGSSSNYNFVLQAGTLTITPSPLVAKADDKTKTYGQVNPVLSITYAGFLNGDNSASITEPSISTSATVSSIVGNYPISLVGGASSNYTIILQNGTLTISKAILTAKADDKSRVYGQTNPINSITYTGFVNGDLVSSITPPVINGPNATATSNAGVYPITLSGGVSTNYAFNFVDGSLTITKAILTAMAENKTQVYGQSTPSLTMVYSGFVNGENATVISTLPSASTNANSTSSVGNYSITVSGGVATNYNFNYVAGTLTITKATLTAIADDKSKQYGSLNPPFTISYTGFVNGDNVSSITPPTVSSLASITSNVGGYVISLSGGGAANYDFILQSGALTVTKAALTATANNQSRSFGAPNPLLDISYAGFVNGETKAVIDLEPSASTTANVSSPIGTYAITVAGGNDNNYFFNYVSGVLTILPSAAPTIKNFSVTTAEDNAIIFNYASFGSNFTSSPGDVIKEVRIKTLPLNGVLKSGAVTLKKDDFVTVTQGQLDDLRYVPNKDYFGSDNFKWNVFNGTFEAQVDAQVSISITPVNDSPVLSNIELTPLEYSPGDPPKKVSQQLIISDIDNSNLIAATITISENKSNGDQLTLDPSFVTTLVSNFDKNVGVLSISGKDSRSNYEKAINSILFRTGVSANALDRKVTFLVSDTLTSSSNVVSRVIKITETLPELGLVNSFTPNNDGVNDEWDFVNLQSYSQVLISVFDKTGSKVFDCNSNDCKWDGKAGGKELPVGPYLYTIDLNGGKRRYQGIVTILK